MNEKLLKYFKGDELAANVWLSKYAYEGEETPDDMHMRMAKEFARVDNGYIPDEIIKGRDELSTYGKSRSNLTIDSIYELFKDFKYIVPQGSIMATLGTDIIASLSNCWVAGSPLDSYGGILRTDGDLAYYYKRRGGVGTDLSHIRPRSTKTNNAAKSTTGVVSFMHRYSNTTREVAQDGRRGALMLSLSIVHPDSMEFIKVKRDGTSVTGANISLRITDDFMQAVKKDEDFILKFPIDIDIVSGSTDDSEYNKLYKNPSGNTYWKKIKAKEYWDEIINSAKNYAEPGLLYWDNLLNYDPAAVYPQYKPTSTNPCGEQALNPYDSCRLMALNLFSFVKKPFKEKAQLSLQKLYEVSYEHFRLGDNLIDLELEYIQRIIDKIKSDPEPDDIKRDELELWKKSYTNSKAGRRIGLGITALADMLAALNMKYDSKEGMDMVNTVMRTIMLAELDAGVDLAILRGSFEGWDLEKEYLKGYHGGYRNNFYKFLANNFDNVVVRMKKHGRRSVSWSTINGGFTQ